MKFKVWYVIPWYVIIGIGTLSLINSGDMTYQSSIWLGVYVVVPLIFVFYFKFVKKQKQLKTTS